MHVYVKYTHCLESSVLGGKQCCINQRSSTFSAWWTGRVGGGEEMVPWEQLVCAPTHTAPFAWAAGSHKWSFVCECEHSELCSSCVRVPASHATGALHTHSPTSCAARFQMGPGPILGRAGAWGLRTHGINDIFIIFVQFCKLLETFPDAKLAPLTSVLNSYQLCYLPCLSCSIWWFIPHCSEGCLNLAERVGEGMRT